MEYREKARTFVSYFSESLKRNKSTMFSMEVFAPTLLKLEGGYQCRLSDDGNKNSEGDYVGTNYGISGRFYERVIGRVPSRADMKAITWEMALGIYEKHFAAPLLLSQIHSQKAAELLFDFAVNSGVPTAVRNVQMALASTLEVDGIMGKKTLAAINALSERDLVDCLLDVRKQFYRYAVEKKPKKLEWFYGWMTRLVVHFENLTKYDAELQALQVLAERLVWESESSREITVATEKPTMPNTYTTFGKKTFDQLFKQQVETADIVTTFFKYLQLRFPKRSGFRWETSQSNATICFVVGNRQGTFYLLVDVVES